MTSIETSTFSGISADISNTAAFIPEEPTHILHYVYTTPEWHDNFIGWAAYIASYLEGFGLTARQGQGGASGIPGTELVYDAVVEVFGKPGAQVLVAIPEALPTEGEWKLIVEKDGATTEYIVAEHDGERVSLDA